MIESILLIVVGIYLIFKAITSKESILKFGVAVEDNSYLFKFSNFAMGLLLIAIGAGKLN
jgi:hypothetical protein